MTVAKDAFSAQAGTSTTDFSWTHTPVGTPKGVIVVIVQNGGTNELNTVTYGGVACTAISGSPRAKSSGEPGAVYIYTLTSGIPTGPQTVAVTVTGATAKAGHAYTVTESTNADTAVVGTVGGNNDSLANPSLTLSLGGRTAFVVLGGTSGQDAPGGITENANWTADAERDFGIATAPVYSYNIIGSTDVSVGWTQTADDVVLLAVGLGTAIGGGANGTSTSYRAAASRRRRR